MDSTGPKGMESTGPTGESGTGPTGMESTGPTGDTETGPTGEVGTGSTGMGPMGMYMSYEITPPLPEILTLADLLSDTQFVITKEQADKALLETIATQSVHSLRPMLVEWVMRGCPNAYPLLKLDIRPPTKCSDGECRCLPDYILFCSGKTIHEHVDSLQAKLPDISVSFANFGGITTIVVSKP